MTERERLVAAYDRALSLPTRSGQAPTGWGKSTAKRYSGIWKAYDAVAIKIGARKLSPVDPLTEDHLAAYAIYLGEADRAPRTIMKEIVALKAWHRIHGLPVPSGRTALGVTREHDHNLRERGWSPRHTNPAPLDHLIRMLATLDRDTTAGRRDAMIIMLGYSMLTLGELAGLDLRDVIDVPAENDADAPGDLLLRVRARGEHALVPVRHWIAADGGHLPALCPVDTIRTGRNEVLDRGADPASPLLRSVDTHGRIGGLDRRARRQVSRSGDRLGPQGIMRALNKAATRAGLAQYRYTLLSLRFGGADAGRAAGGTSTEVAERGGWSVHSPDFAARLAQAERDFAGYGGRLVLPEIGPDDEERR
jgi:integrase